MVRSLLHSLTLHINCSSSVVKNFKWSLGCRLTVSCENLTSYLPSINNVCWDRLKILILTVHPTKNGLGCTNMTIAINKFNKSFSLYNWHWNLKGYKKQVSCTQDGNKLAELFWCFRPQTSRSPAWLMGRVAHESPGMVGIATIPCTASSFPKSILSKRQTQ